MLSVMNASYSTARLYDMSGKNPRDRPLGPNTEQ